MKKIIAIVIALLMAAALFTGCAREERDEHIEPEETRLYHRRTVTNGAGEDGEKKRRFRFPRAFRKYVTTE